MTIVWQPRAANNGELVDGTKSDVGISIDIDRLCDGRSLASVWEPPSITTFAEGAGGRPRKQKPLHLRADVPAGFSTLLLMRNRTRAVVGEVLEPYGEFLPAISLDEGEEYHFFNPTCVVDAIDFERSEVRRLPSGLLVSVRRYVLTEKPELAYPIFRLKDGPTELFFVSDSFRQFWESKGLTGLTFRKIWDSEAPV